VNYELEEAKRQEAFRVLVDLQDRGYSVDASHDEVASQFGITVTQLRCIEREGLDKQWPPL
jgi:hypothetical protein